MANFLSDRTGADIDAQLDKADTLLTPAVGQALYHTGNTGYIEYTTSAGTTNPDGINFRTNFPQVFYSRAGTSAFQHLNFENDNGTVGNISTNGVATSYNTSSDSRLKDFAESPTDSAINAVFDSLFSCFRTFNWKSDPQGDLVWGFSAWDVEDAGLGCASAGEGSRELPLGAVYETIPAVTESRVVLDAEGNPTSEIEEVVITEAIEKRVTPSGVDQGKMTAYLVPMMELQKRQIKALTDRLEAAGL